MCEVTQIMKKKKTLKYKEVKLVIIELKHLLKGQIVLQVKKIFSHQYAPE